MMQKQLTSEEKLLAIIRKKKAPSIPVVKKEEAAPGPKKEDDTSTRGLKLSAGLLKTWNFLAIVIIGGLGIYLLAQVVLTKNISDQAGLQEAFAVGKNSDQPLAEEKILDVSDNPLSLYLSAVQSRDIFLAPWERPMAQDATAAVAINLNEEFKILGIVLDRDPKVIVEDKNGQTSFLSKGDLMSGAELLEIREDRAVFLYNGQKVEILP